MSKKRPRIAACQSKRDAAYWRDRLYRNVFTYKGRQVEVRSWSVKIQMHGRRRAFTLNSTNRTEAAKEACQLYQQIFQHGWEGLDENRISTDLRPASNSPAFANNVEYWKPRLLQRKYPEQGRGFSARIEHGGTAYYFPFGTTDEDEAAAQAMRVYRTVINQGWDRATQLFPRELSLALRWQDNPLAWTYTTFHTRQQPEPPKPNNTDRSERSVVFIESDASVRAALAAHTNGQPGFRCDSSFACAPDALREIPRRPVNLVLANHDLPGENIACFEELHRIRPDLVVLSYSVFPDPDELFKSTPGGSVVYLLKRTSPWHLFEPIASLTETLTHEAIATHVRKYFQELAALLPSGPPFWKTARLTPREQEILALLAKGDLVKEIAAKLGISNWTVQGHVKSIFEKLQVHSRTEAVIKYLQR